MQAAAGRLRPVRCGRSPDRAADASATSLARSGDRPERPQAQTGSVWRLARASADASATSLARSGDRPELKSTCCGRSPDRAASASATSLARSGDWPERPQTRPQASLARSGDWPERPQTRPQAQSGSVWRLGTISQGERPELKSTCCGRSPDLRCGRSLRDVPIS